MLKSSSKSRKTLFFGIYISFCKYSWHPKAEAANADAEIPEKPLPGHEF